MLHLTKVAFGATDLTHLVQRVADRAEDGRVAISTRYGPKREAELEGGSLYWILRHQLVARQAILAFDHDSEPGRCRIWLDARLVPVLPVPCRAHQGWRYLEGPNAPADLQAEGNDGMAALPPDLLRALATLCLP